MKELSVAMSMYQEEYDHLLTPTSDWNARLLPYNGWKNSLNDEFLPKDGERRGIGLNPGVAAKDSSKFESPSETIVFGVTRYPGEDALVTASTTQLDFRCMIGFADGFAKRVAPNSLRPSQWTPVIVKDYEKE
ncbi:MAG: hypothetical protein K8R88_05470 [Armatimonadetes bacterium]|nr:hypothetical protein [Armatimonadota bacterium]